MRESLIYYLSDLWRKAENKLCEHDDTEALELKEKFDLVCEKNNLTAEELNELHTEIESSGG